MEKEEIIKLMKEKGFELIEDNRLFPQKNTIQYILNVKGNIATSIKFKLIPKEQNKKGCGKPVSNSFYPHFKCGEKDSNNKIYYCDKCKSQDKEELCECGHSKGFHNSKGIGKGCHLCDCKQHFSQDKSEQIKHEIDKDYANQQNKEQEIK